MMRGNTWHAWLGIVGIVGLSASLLVGCGTTKPSRFYLLTAQVDPGAGSGGEEPGPELGVGPVEVPEYLNRPQMVTRTGTNEVQVAEYDRWAEPIKDSLTRVLAENLSLLLATEKVSLYPARGAAPPEWRVTVMLTHLDIRLGENVILAGWWRLFRARGDVALPSRKVELSEPIGGEDSYEAAALAASRAVARLSGEIAAAIKETQDGG